MADLSCCRNRPFDQADRLCIKDHNQLQEIDLENEESFSFPCDMLDDPVRAWFDDDEVATPLELHVLEIFERLTRHESILSSPPEGFLSNCHAHLLSTKTSFVSIFTEEKNKLSDQFHGKMLVGCQKFNPLID